MAQIAETSLEARIEQLEAFARSISAGNLTDLASVVNAAGRYVPLSSLAFGLVGATDTGLVELNGGNPASGVGDTGWSYGTPTVNVYVTGGNLLVLAASSVHAQGNKTGMNHSYRLLGPTATAGAAAGVAALPAYDRAVFVFDAGFGQGTDIGAATFGLHSGLAAGWYQVQSAYSLYWSGGMFTYGFAKNRRVAAMPF